MFNPERRTNAQMLEAMYLNKREASQTVARLVQLYEDLPIGDPRRNGSKDSPSLLEQLRRARSDERHWDEQIVWWRRRCVAEGDDALPPGRFEARTGDGASEIAEAARQRMNSADAGRVR